MTDLTNALSRIEELEAENERLRGVLSFYGDEASYLFVSDYGILEFGDRNVELTGTMRVGFKARAALNQQEPTDEH